MLWVYPSITPDGRFFKDLWLDHTRNKRTVWLVNAANPHRPALMEWWKGFKFDGGDASHCSPKSMLAPAGAFDPAVSPNGQSEEFARLGLDYLLKELRAAWKMGGQPLAQRLRGKNHD